MKRAFIHHAHMVTINLQRANHSQVSLRACSVSTVLFRFGTMIDRLSKMGRQLTRLLLFWSNVTYKVDSPRRQAASAKKPANVVFATPGAPVIGSRSYGMSSL